jgi:hypothetical protein
MSGTSLQELMELVRLEVVRDDLSYAHLAPEHLASAAARIERELAVVGENSTVLYVRKDKG